MKSTVCTLSSARPSAITVAHVPLPPTLVGLTSPLSSLPTKPASGELGAATTALGPEAQAFQAPAQPFGQTLLGARAPLLVRLETGAHGCHSRDRGPLASRRLPPVLESDLQGEGASGKEAGAQGGQEPDLSNGRGESDLGCSSHSRRTDDAWVGCVRANDLALDEASATRPPTREALAQFSSQSPGSHCRHGLLHGAHDRFRLLVLLLRHQSRPPAYSPLQRYASSHQPLDRAAVTGSVSLRVRSSVPALGSGRKVRAGSSGSHTIDEHRRGPNFLPKSLAERDCRTLGGHLPT